MGENQNQPFQLSFNASLKADLQGSQVTSDGGSSRGGEVCDDRLRAEAVFGAQGSGRRRCGPLRAMRKPSAAKLMLRR